MSIKGNVLLVGTPWIMRQGVKHILRRIGLLVAGEGDNLAGAVTTGNAACGPAAFPSLVLAINSHAGTFAAALDHLGAAAARFPGTKLVLLADGLDEAAIRTAARAGVHALLSPSFPAHMIASSLQLVLLGHNLFPVPLSVPIAPPGTATPVLIPAGMRKHSAPTPAPPPARIDAHRHPPGAPAPSDREWDILDHLAEGWSNKRIALKLGISETTVKVHVKSLLRKLGVANRTQAAVWALSHGRTGAPLASPG